MTLAVGCVHFAHLDRALLLLSQNSITGSPERKRQGRLNFADRTDLSYINRLSPLPSIQGSRGLETLEVAT